jgi:hypothetical protein
MVPLQQATPWGNECILPTMKTVPIRTQMTHFHLGVPWMALDMAKY